VAAPIGGGGERRRLLIPGGGGGDNGEREKTRKHGQRAIRYGRKTRIKTGGGVNDEKTGGGVCDGRKKADGTHPRWKTEHLDSF
jgi:hypothetical protein